MTMKISTIIKEWVPNKSKVIDFGCGDGTLLKDLIKEKNVEEAALISKKYEKLFNILLENSPGPSKYLLAKIKMLENNLRLPLVKISEKLGKEIDEIYSNT